MGTRKAKQSSGSSGSTKMVHIKAESPGSTGENMSSGALRTLKARKARQAKRELTKDSVENSNANAEITMTNAARIRQGSPVLNPDSNKPDPSNGRVHGRKLIRWSPTLDQVLLLHMEYELKRRGIDIPFQAIADRFSGEKNTSGSCIQQHLAKLRIQLLDRGAWVPPLPGRGGNKKDDVRGVVKGTDANGREYERVVGWGEDTSHIFERLENELSGSRKRKASNFQKSKGQTFSAEHMKAGASAGTRNRQSNKIKAEDIDPSELVSDDDYDPSNTRLKSKAKSKKAMQNADSDNDDDSDEGYIASRAARMMEFEDFEKEHVDKKVVVLKASSESLAKYPTGVSTSSGDWSDPHGTVQTVSMHSAESQGESEDCVSESASENDSSDGDSEGDAYSDGDADDEDRSDIGIERPISPSGFANFAYQANNMAPALNPNMTFDPNMVSGQNMTFDPNMAIDHNIAFDPNMATNPNTAFNPNMAFDPNWDFDPNWAFDPNLVFNEGSVIDPNMGIDPMFLNNHLSGPNNLSANWSDSLMYGENNPSAFQDGYGDANGNWDSNVNMISANNMANSNDLSINNGSGLINSYGIQLNSRLLSNADGTIDSTGASMSQSHGKRTKSSTESISGREHTQCSNSLINCRELVNEEGQHNGNLGHGYFAPNGLPESRYPSM